MVLTRAQAATHIAGTLGSLFTLLGVGTADTAGQLKEPIDEALLAIGVAWGDLATASVADADVPGFLAVLRVRALLRLQFAAVAGNAKTEISGNDVTIKYADVGKRIDGLLTAALAGADAYGLGLSNSWQVPGSVSTDYLEPAPVVG
jgi:hypothetical protein